MEIIANYGNVLIIMAIVFGVFMAWGIGANDVANAMGTSVGSGAVTIKQAIIIAVIFGLPIFIVKHLKFSKVLQYEIRQYCNCP